MLLKILQDKFSKNCNNTLYEDIVGYEYDVLERFESFIYTAFKNMTDDKDKIKVKDRKEDNRTPYEILDEAGYELHECLTEEDIQEYRKYYKEDEVLCTISFGGRLNSKVCFWAVKKDADEIKREDFIEPHKRDEYSTSVLAIQFSKAPESHVEIISRYNHAVPNPNCTLSNNLDNIAEGLHESFARLLEERGYSLDTPEVDYFEIPGYTIASDGKYYSFNQEINGIYYCPGNIVIGQDGVVTEIGKPEETILCDYFKIDLKNRTVENLLQQEPSSGQAICYDSFVDDLTDIEKIEVKKGKAKGRRTIIIHKKDESDETIDPEPIVIELNKNNQIIGYQNKGLKNVGRGFLIYNVMLESLDLPQAETIGDVVLRHNTYLRNLDLPKVKTIGTNFLGDNTVLEKINLPKVEEIKNGFLRNNLCILDLDLPNVQTIGSNFMERNSYLRNLYMPQVQYVGNKFLFHNNNIGNKISGYGEDYFEAIRNLSSKKEQGNITPEDAARSALSQGITTEQVDQANKIEEKQTKEKINEGELIDGK